MQISLIEKEKENELLRNDILMLKEKNQNLINDKCLPLKSTDNSDVTEKRFYVLRLNPLPQEQEIFPSTTNEKEPEFKSIDNNNLSITDLQEQLSNSEKKLARLMEIFKQKIKQFREVVFTLLGYQIDMQSDGSIKLRSLYAFHEDDWIEFRRDDFNKRNEIDGKFISDSIFRRIGKICEEGEFNSCISFFCYQLVVG